jgi:hypothetical protein
MSIPALYAYMVPAEDTRYLYFLFPIFSLLSAIIISRYLNNSKLKNYFLIIIISGIIIGSLLFYEYKKDDWRMDVNTEKEYLKISQEILEFAEGINYHPTIGRYLNVEQLPNQWPVSHNDILSKTELISPLTNNSLNEFIEQNRKLLTHVVVDDRSNLPKFLIEINKKEFSFLDLVYEYEIEEKEEKFKVFKINYDQFDAINDKGKELGKN